MRWHNHPLWLYTCMSGQVSYLDKFSNPISSQGCEVLSLILQLRHKDASAFDICIKQRRRSAALPQTMISRLATSQISFFITLSLFKNLLFTALLFCL